MANDITLEAVRLALTMNQMRAEVAGQNIARASQPGAAATHLDFGRSQSLLDLAAQSAPADSDGLAQSLGAAADHSAELASTVVSGAGVNLDEEVADMATANLKYQALGESLSRHFGLLRLAITGKN